MPPAPTYPLVRVECSPDDVDAMIGRLTLLGADGIEERDATTLARPGAHGATLLASFATRDEAERAVDELAPHAHHEELVGDAWRDAWKDHWRPTPLCAGIVVVPSWIEHAPAPGERVLRLDPGRAFGTGQHASTTLAADAMAHAIAGAVPDRVIDVGTGSGVLAFAAVLLGVREVIACDLDPDAVTAANENRESLGLTDAVEFRVGSVECIPEDAPLVLANIEAGVLIPMASALAARVRPGGALVLSGVLATQERAVVEAYRAHGLAFVAAAERQGWIAPTFERPR